jgi:hypothetical protein
MYRVPQPPEDEDRRRALIALDALATGNRLDAQRSAARLRVRRLHIVLVGVVALAFVAVDAGFWWAAKARSGARFEAPRNFSTQTPVGGDPDVHEARARKNARASVTHAPTL